MSLGKLVEQAETTVNALSHLVNVYGKLNIEIESNVFIGSVEYYNLGKNVDALISIVSKYEYIKTSHLCELMQITIETYSQFIQQFKDLKWIRKNLFQEQLYY